MWELFVILLSLGLLMYTAYKGFSVILMAPICALLAVLLINPANVLPFIRVFLCPKW
ncbi:Citrate transporter family protein [Acinetobacter baumannii ABNIH6]|nr:Citrate transporter family protein [Acinetobacter baumannii ABNIH6]